MTLRSIFGEAFAALRFNRQRSLLTMASLGWGVACFVILYSYGEGFGLALRTSFQAVGQDLVRSAQDDAAVADRSKERSACPGWS